MLSRESVLIHFGSVLTNIGSCPRIVERVGVIGGQSYILYLSVAPKIPIADGGKWLVYILRMFACHEADPSSILRVCGMDQIAQLPNCTVYSFGVECVRVFPGTISLTRLQTSIIL